MTGPKRIALGADHGGFNLKAVLAAHLRKTGHQVEDVGTSSREAVDYPVFARAVAEAVSQGRADAGIVVDGAGIGSCMAANKVPGVRAAVANTLLSAQHSREHNDANVLTLGASLIGAGLAQQIVSVGDARHGPRAVPVVVGALVLEDLGGLGVVAEALGQLGSVVGQQDPGLIHQGSRDRHSLHFSA